MTAVPMVIAMTANVNIVRLQQYTITQTDIQMYTYRERDRLIDTHRNTQRDRSRRCVIAESLGLRKVCPGRSAARIPSAVDPEYPADCGPRANPRKPPHIAGVS